LGIERLAYPFFVIPFQVDTAVEVADAILNNLVCFLMEGITEVLETVFANIFDTEIIDCKVKPGGPVFVSPEARGMGLLVVAVWGESFLEEFVSKDTGLGESVNLFANFHVDVTIKRFFFEHVVFNVILRDERERYGSELGRSLTVASISIDPSLSPPG
jgi:hypothetical protein